jgi:post-segregation antitoxin (ccd killing protein)
MNVNVYLPNDLGRQAKEAGLPLSQLLRAAVTDELERRQALTETLEEVAEHQILFEDSSGRTIKGRLTGTLIGEDKRTQAFLTDDQRVIVYELDKLRYQELADPENELRDWLDDDGYIDAMIALGLEPVVDI